MPKLVLANGALLSSSGIPFADFAELPESEQRALRRQAQRAVWSAADGDLLILPLHPGEDFLRHAAELAGLDRSTLSVLVAPFGEFGVHVPLGHRSGLSDFERLVSQEVRRLGLDRLWAYFFDVSVAALTKRVGLHTGTPGFHFAEEGGVALLNNKATFRALAVGTGAAVPEGIVTASRDDAESFLSGLLAEGHSGIVKRAENAGGLGNDLLSPEPGIEPVGASRTAILGDRLALERHLADWWDDYTDAGRRAVVIERYYPSSVPIYVGLHITEQGIEPYGYGEMLMSPLFSGVAVPPDAVDHRHFPSFLEQATRLGEAVRLMGYRGRLSVDAMVTPAGAILLNEINARAGGATHTHNIAQRAGAGIGTADRHLLDCRHQPTVPLSDALHLLADHGLAYDPETRSGVIITVHDTTSTPGYGEFCAVAPTSEAALSLEHQALAAFSQPPRTR